MALLVNFTKHLNIFKKQFDINFQKIEKGALPETFMRSVLPLMPKPTMHYKKENYSTISFMKIGVKFLISNQIQQYIKG